MPVNTHKFFRCLLGIFYWGTMASTNIFSQSFAEKDFTLYTPQEGLSAKMVTDISGDRFGFIWISTDKGLNRFDGKTFKQYYVDTGLNSLPTDHIKNLAWLNKEELACITSSGLHVLHTVTQHQRNLFVPTKEDEYGYIANNVYAVTGDRLGNKYLLTSSGFYHFNSMDKIVFRYDHTFENNTSFSGVPFGRTNGICMPEPGIILLATTNGAYQYSISQKKLTPISHDDSSFYGKIKKPEINIRFMHFQDGSFSVQQEDAKELSFFDTRNQKIHPIRSPFDATKIFNWRSRLFKINDSVFAITAKERGFYLMLFDKPTQSFRIQPELYFKNFLCTSMFLDAGNRWWIGTNKGAFRQNKINAHIEHIHVEPFMNSFNRDLPVQMIALAKDKIFAASNGEGLLVFDRETKKGLAKIDFRKYATMGNHVYSVLALNEDSLLIGVGGALLRMHAQTYKHEQVQLPNWNNDKNWVAAMFKDSRNNLFICPNGENELYIKLPEHTFKHLKYSSTSNFNILTPRYISEDPSGNIWFAGHGISRFNYRLQQFDKRIASFLRHKNARPESTQPQFGKDGKLYVGLNENGLLIYDTIHHKTEQITRNNGLPDNHIKAIYLHGNHLWMGTESGIAKMDIHNRNISSFGVSDGLPGDPFTAYTFYYDSIHHHMYAGFNNAIVRFNPDSLQKNSLPPSFFIESISVSGMKTIYHPSDTLNLSHRQNTLLLQLVAINFEDAHRQQFAYRLVKTGNENWQHTGNQQQLILSALPPGKYMLQVMVFINNHSWVPQIKSLYLIIKPPFWQTRWFWLMISFTAIALLYYLYRLRINNIHKKNNIEKQLAELEIKGLHAQMNPHFIFNALNSIKEMIIDGERQSASRYLSKFAQLLRTSLYHSRQTFISIQQCIDHLQQYLEMEKLRFKDFTFSIETDHDISANEENIAPMLVQPLVENAIWHGLRTAEGDRKLMIRFLKAPNGIICEVEDNGIGINKATLQNTGRLPDQNSFGIDNIKERLKVLNEKYQMNCSLEIMDKADLSNNKESGTLAILKIYEK